MSVSVEELVVLCNDLQTQVTQHCQSNDQSINQNIMQLLLKIQQFPMNLSMLKESKAGVTLNHIKKDLCTKQADNPAVNLIKIIVKQWKDLAINQSLVQSIVQSSSSPSTTEQSNQPTVTPNNPPEAASPKSNKSPTNRSTGDLRSTANRRKRVRDDSSDDEQPNKHAKSPSDELSPSSAPAYTMTDLQSIYQSTSASSNNQSNNESLDDDDMFTSDQPVIQSESQPKQLPIINPNTFVFHQPTRQSVDVTSNDETNDPSDNDDVIDESFDPTSKSRNKRSLDIDLIDESIPDPNVQSITGPVRICSLVQMCSDHLVINLSKVHRFTLLPSEMIGKILYKGLINLPIHQSINQLTKFEKACPQLHPNDTDALWKILVMKKFQLTEQGMQEGLDQLNSQSTKPSPSNDNTPNKPITKPNVNQPNTTSKSLVKPVSGATKPSLTHSNPSTTRATTPQPKSMPGKSSSTAPSSLVASRSNSDANKSSTSSAAPPSAVGAAGVYHRLFIHLESQKNSKLATLGSRLKQRAETEKKERSDTKMMSVSHAVNGMKQIKSVQNLINKSQAANSPPSQSSQSSKAGANRVTSLRKQTKAVAKSVWSKANAVGRK